MRSASDARLLPDLQSHWPESSLHWGPREPAREQRQGRQAPFSLLWPGGQGAGEGQLWLDFPLPSSLTLSLFPARHSALFRRHRFLY